MVAFVVRPSNPTILSQLHNLKQRNSNLPPLHNLKQLSNNLKQLSSNSDSLQLHTLKQRSSNLPQVMSLGWIYSTNW